MEDVPGVHCLSYHRFIENKLQRDVKGTFWQIFCFKLRHEKPDSAVPDIYVFMFKIYMLLFLALATSFGGR